MTVSLFIFFLITLVLCIFVIIFESKKYPKIRKTEKYSKMLLLCQYDKYVEFTTQNNLTPLSYKEWCKYRKKRIKEENEKDEVINGKDGKDGKDGKNGLSAYEIFKKHYPKYKGTEAEWIKAVALSDKCSLFGHDYDNGKVLKQATTKNEGEKIFTCSVCKHTKTEIIPRIKLYYESEGEFFLNFGFYPQSHVNDTNLIRELNKVSKPNLRGNYEYNGIEYAKINLQPNMLANTYDNYGNNIFFTYSDGARIKESNVEWFKVEPIKWRVIREKEEAVQLVSDMILDTSCFYNSRIYRKIKNKDIVPCNYMYSTVREFLNKYFYNNAFTEEQKNLILTTKVDNSANSTGNNNNQYICGNTSDKVFLLSYKEAKEENLYLKNDKSIKITDYAIAKGADGNSLLRSPYFDDSSCVWYFNRNKEVFDYDYVNILSYGIIPSLKIKK